VLRFNWEERRAVGVTLMDVSLLRAATHGAGLLLDGMADLAPEW